MKSMKASKSASLLPPLSLTAPRSNGRTRINASSPRRMKSMNTSKSASAFPPLSQRTSTPAPPHYFGDNHSIFDKEKWGSPAQPKLKHNELRDPSISANWGRFTAPRCFEDALLGNARRERVEVEDRVMVGNRVHTYLGQPSATRQHTDGIVSWDCRAGESVRRRRASIPSRKHLIPGGSLERKEHEEKLQKAQDEAVDGLLKKQAHLPPGATTSILHGRSSEAAPDALPPHLLFQARPELLRLRTPAVRCLQRGAMLAAGDA